jgi:hypothetical protein
VTLEGRLLGPQGSVAGVEVMLWPVRENECLYGWFESGHTDGEGRFSVEGLASFSRFDVYLRTPEGMVTRIAQSVSPAGSPLEIRIGASDLK